MSSKALVHDVQQICFSSGLCFFCCLNHLTKNVREALLHHMCPNPLTPDSPTSGAVTLISKGQTSIMLPLSINDPCLHKGGCILLWRALVLSLPCPKVTAGAAGIGSSQGQSTIIKDLSGKDHKTEELSVCVYLFPPKARIQCYLDITELY